MRLVARRTTSTPGRARALVALGVLGSTLVASHASAVGAGPILHEPISVDPNDDARMGVGIEGDLPAALETPSGTVQAPDPRRPLPPTPARTPPTSGIANAPPNFKFAMDNKTDRPDVLPYDDPFTPSTAPFKRLLAFDTVTPGYELAVRDPRLVPFPAKATPAADGSDDLFYGDIVVDLSPARPARIPTVGPGAKILRAHAGVGSADVPVRFFRDGAENWFAEADVTTRARLVMEIAAPRAAFGGEFGDPSWADLPKVGPLPSGVARDAAEVAARIGVSRAEPPREVVTRLVAYFRSFADSKDFPDERHDVYLDLALSKKGVCRHRAFAFLVTALGLGLPTRMISNEAHAWVEVNDGALWRRIDLGGAGRALDAPLASGVRHEAPPDPFGWPPSAQPGTELADRAESATSSPGNGNGGNGPSHANTSGANGQAASSSETSSARGGLGTPSGPDERPASRVAVAVLDGDPRRGAPLRVHGDVSAEGSACGHILVDFALRDGRGHEVPLGALSTGDDGAYEGALVVPNGAALGEYDVVARTNGDARCGKGGPP
jgi:hypothetical protein